MLTRERKHRTLRIQGTFDAIWHRVALFVLLVLSAAFLLLSRSEAQFVTDVRDGATDFLAPGLALASEPLNWIESGVEQVGALASLYSENERLREENERLKEWQHVALGLEQKVARYQALLNLKPDPATAVVTGRVIAEAGGPFVYTLIVNAGGGDGVAVGQAAISGSGFVGRVVGAGDAASRILLIQDVNSRIPVVVEPSGARAILIGDSSGQPRLDYLASTATVNLGDRVVTAGDGGLLPPGLPVGVVAGEAGDWGVLPFAQSAHVDHVRILRYDFPRDVETPGSAAVATVPDAVGESLQ